MKSNIITYLQTYGQETFAERAFSEVDALILCQFSYLKFDGIIPGIPEWPAESEGQNENRADAAETANGIPQKQTGVVETADGFPEKQTDIGNYADRLPGLVTILDIWRNQNREKLSRKS